MLAPVMLVRDGRITVGFFWVIDVFSPFPSLWLPLASA